jgi:hypothetical protein
MADRSAMGGELKLPAAPLRGIKQLYLRIIEDKPRAFNVQQIK